jgi:uncharacterized cupredoxin-like copper-binding protein
VSRFRRGTVVIAVGALAALAVAVAAQGRTDVTAQRVAVTATEFKFTVKPKTVRKGRPVVFTLTNRGNVAHDFRIGGRKTKVLAAGKRGTVRVTFRKAGRYRYICTLPSHAIAGMEGVLVVR